MFGRKKSCNFLSNVDSKTCLLAVGSKTDPQNIFTFLIWKQQQQMVGIQMARSLIITHILWSTVSCVHRVEVVAKRLSVLVQFSFPAFSIFKLIICCNLNSPQCELSSCDQPDVTQIQIREATELPAELFYILSPFLHFYLFYWKQ